MTHPSSATPPAAPVPILRSVLAAYAFLISHWQRALIAAAPYTLAYAAQLVLMQAIGGATGNPVLAMGMFLLSLVTVVASLALSAACLRMAVLGDYSGWHSLKAGADEGRIFIVSLLVAALTLLVFIMAFMFWAVVLGSIAAGAMSRAGIDPEAEGLELVDAMAYLGAADWVVAGVVGLAAAALLVWLSARLALALPATIANRKIMVLSAWSLSGGNAARIAAALLLTGLPLLVLELGLYELICAMLGFRPLYLAVPVGSEQINAPALAAAEEYLRWNGLMAFINVPVFSGLYAYIYRNRTAVAAAGDRTV
ncbi:hypothetical protein [Maricaulis salignorans]|uniref:Uncharacterized protein n=1 Tax=Maricaulis salignorans TaxID=144026 RepID=A0A1G9PUA5_9PROT|nr:hypothetical protein [Maricaulis salignorans]SDM02372.1 hypothetical protein SAMN04488568_10434 [Maricaulis salignorans]